MADILNINTEVIKNVASSIATKNEELYTSLERSSSSMKGLSGNWTGKGGQAMIGAYSSFANKYFDSYRQMLQEYVVFLRSISADRFEKAEQQIADKSAEI